MALVRVRFGYRFRFENDPRTELLEDPAKRCVEKLRFDYRFNSRRIREQNSSKMIRNEPG
jgi:hypothetical protein